MRVPMILRQLFLVPIEGYLLNMVGACIPVLCTGIHHRHSDPYHAAGYVMSILLAGVVYLINRLYYKMGDLKSSSGCIMMYHVILGWNVYHENHFELFTAIEDDCLDRALVLATLLRVGYEIVLMMNFHPFVHHEQQGEDKAIHASEQGLRA